MQSVKYKFGRGPHSTPLPSTAQFGSSIGNEADALIGFNNNRPTNSVSVENIPDHGEVRSFQDIRDGHSPRLDITFSDQDAAASVIFNIIPSIIMMIPLQKSLVYEWVYSRRLSSAITEANQDSLPSTVSALTMSSPVTRTNKRSTDDRRNLYVLGLPFALTKNEFASLFAPYGTVSHCVILATVDNSSRRRGFVVMSSHEEAKQAMSALTRTQIKGHAIDVSWAVVQRSQGFLDGGDRAMLLDSRSHLPSPSPKLHERHSIASSDTSDSSLGSHDADASSLATSSTPTSSLLVSNLPTLFFSQAQDLHPLFFPFGHIEKLEIVQVSPLGTMSVIVQYSSASVAQEAKETLSGQVYGSYQIEARYVRPANMTSGLLSHAPTSTPVGVTPLDKTFGALSPPDYLTQAGGIVDQTAHFGNPSVMKNAPSFNTFGTMSAAGLSSYNMFGNPQPRQTPLSAIHPAFSNVFHDFNESRPTSASSRWSVDQTYGSMSDHQRQYAHSNAMHFNTVYQSSAA